MNGVRCGRVCHRKLLVISGIFMERQAKYEKRFRIFRVCEHLKLALAEYKSKTPSERACCACVGLYELAVYNIRPLILAEHILEEEKHTVCYYKHHHFSYFIT